MRRDADVFIVIDTSRSMLAATAAGAPTRFERATAIAKRLRDATPTAAVGIASLTDRVLPHLFPTEDRAEFDVTLRDAIAVQRPPPAENIGGSGTRSRRSAISRRPVSSRRRRARASRSCSPMESHNPSRLSAPRRRSSGHVSSRC